MVQHELANVSVSQVNRKLLPPSLQSDLVSGLEVFVVSIIAKFIRTRYLTHLRQEVGDVLAGLRQLALARRQASMPTEDERSRIQQEDELVASFLNLG